MLASLQKPIESNISKIYIFRKKSKLKLPLYSSRVSAGIPDMLDPDIEEITDLNTELVKNPTKTYLAEVNGDSMIGLGIESGDLLTVDRSLEIKNGDLIIASVNGANVLKTIKKINGKIYLFPANDNYEPIEITEYMDLRIYGVVTSFTRKIIRNK